MSAIAESQVPQVIQRVRERLTKLGKEVNADLLVEERDYRLEDDWLYVVIAPAHAGGRASDYANLMAKVEKELHMDHIDNVLLVPAIPD